MDISKRDFMSLEYQNLPALIAHWDSHFWHKSQWFFAVESVLLGAFGIGFKETLLTGVAPAKPALVVLAAACVFNFWICYVWFRTNRSNREFLTPLLQRARGIEVAFLENDTGTFSAQQKSLISREHSRHSSNRWENHLPTGFALAWATALLSTAACVGRLYVAPTLGMLSFSLVALLMIERFHPERHGAAGSPKSDYAPMRKTDTSPG